MDVSWQRSFQGPTLGQRLQLKGREHLCFPRIQNGRRSLLSPILISLSRDGRIRIITETPVSVGWDSLEDKKLNQFSPWSICSFSKTLKVLALFCSRRPMEMYLTFSLVLVLQSEDGTSREEEVEWEPKRRPYLFVFVWRNSKAL